jgi:hypothetical protein
MLRNPNECRARAAYCADVAAETTSTIVKTAFSDFARQWANLATDIEMGNIGPSSRMPASVNPTMPEVERSRRHQPL